MASTPATKQLPFARLSHPDPQINAIVQDIYNKLQQIQAQLATVIPTNSKP